MIAPYRAPAPGGRGVLDFLQDYLTSGEQRLGMEQTRALQGENADVARATRNNLNETNNFAPGVDPFGIQRFNVVDQDMTQKGTLFDQGQDDRTANRAFAESLMGRLSQNPEYTNDPLTGSILETGGNSQDAYKSLMSILGGEREQSIRNTGEMDLLKEKFALGDQRQQDQNRMFQQYLQGENVPIDPNLINEYSLGIRQSSLEQQQQQALMEQKKLEAIQRREYASAQTQQASDEAGYGQPGTYSPLGGYGNIPLPQQGQPQQPADNDKVLTDLEKERQQSGVIREKLGEGGKMTLQILLKLLEGAGNVKG